MSLGNKGLCVAKMVPVTGPPSDAGSLDYKIHMTEVTRGQYDDWLASNPVLPASTDLNCVYVTSYAEQGTGYTGTDADHHRICMAARIFQTAVMNSALPQADSKGSR